METLQQAAQAALDVQNACNLSGVVHSYSKAMSILWRDVGGGTDAINRHPVAVLFAIQVGYLTQTCLVSDDISGYNKAVKECERLAKGVA